MPTGRRVILTGRSSRTTGAATASRGTPRASLRQGVREQIEYPADGQDVWVTRIVKDSTGKVIHKETFYSHYAQMIGVILIGKKGK